MRHRWISRFSAWHLDFAEFGLLAGLGFIWNLVEGVNIRREYIFGGRTTLAGGEGDMCRLNFSAKYNFN